MILFAWFVFFLPDYLGHADNYTPANNLVTPPHIVPEWYFLPYYAILRAIPSKLFGVIAMFASIAVLYLVPWLDTRRVRSTKYRPLYRWFFWLFVFTCVALGYLGSKPPEGEYVSGHGFSRPTISRTSFSSCRSSACWRSRGRCRAPSPRRCSARTRRHRRPPRRQRSKGACHEQSRFGLQVRRRPCFRPGLARRGGRAKPRTRARSTRPSVNTGRLRVSAASMTKRSSSAASRSTRTSARPATA